MKKGHLLIVDDQNLIIRHLPEEIKSLYEIECVDEGHQSLSMLKEKDINLVLINLMLSKLDSLSLSQRIKQLNLDYQPSILFLTAAFYSNSLRNACLNAGGNDIIFTPLTDWDIIEKITKIRNQQKIKVN